MRSGRSRKHQKKKRSRLESCSASRSCASRDQSAALTLLIVWAEPWPPQWHFNTRHGSARLAFRVMSKSTSWPTACSAKRQTLRWSASRGGEQWPGHLCLATATVSLTLPFAPSVATVVAPLVHSTTRTSKANRLNHHFVAEDEEPTDAVSKASVPYNPTLPRPPQSQNPFRVQENHQHPVGGRTSLHLHQWQFITSTTGSSRLSGGGIPFHSWKPGHSYHLPLND